MRKFDWIDWSILIIIVVIIVLGLASCVSIYDNSTPLKIVKFAETNAFKIDSGSLTGSGIFIDKNRMISACHVVNGEDTVTATRNALSIEMKVDKCDTTKDLALLSPVEPILFQLEKIRIPNDTPYRGQVLYGAGFPLGSDILILTSGEWQGYSPDADRHIITVTTIMGDSGSGAIYLDRFNRVTLAGIRAEILVIPAQFGMFYVTHLTAVRDSWSVNRFLYTLEAT